MRYMTVSEARQRIKDAIASGLYVPIHREYYRTNGVVKGCALCGLYIGCGGEQISRRQKDLFARWELEDGAALRDFIESGVTAPPVRENDHRILEAGYENFEHAIINGFWKIADQSDPWYKLGVALRTGELAEEIEKELKENGEEEERKRKR